MTGPLSVVESTAETYRGPADGPTAAHWRKVVQRWLSDNIDIDGQRSADIGLAVYEALANCVDHAYTHHRGGGEMVLEMQHDPDDVAVKICVTDRGRWVDPDSARRDSTRGRGLVLMYTLSDACTVDGRDDGTTVCLHFHDCPPQDRARQTRAG